MLLMGNHELQYALNDVTFMNDYLAKDDKLWDKDKRIEALKWFKTSFNMIHFQHGYLFVHGGLLPKHINLYLPQSEDGKKK